VELTKRQGKILNRLVEEYIDSAEPISSKVLQKKYDFGICPATIRIEMQKLTDSGFIFQPHTSAGRVPTDKGYRFFVDNLFEKGFPEEKDTLKMEDLIEKEVGDRVKFLQSPERSDGWRRTNVLRLLTKNLASFSSNLALGYLFDEDILWEEGWKEVLQEPEFKETKLVSNFADVIKHFEEEIEDLKINSRIKVFIGKENPFSKVKDFSIIISKCHFPAGEEDLSSSLPATLSRGARKSGSSFDFAAARVKEKGVLAILGPKRMAYDKNINSLNSLTRLLERL